MCTHGRTLRYTKYGLRAQQSQVIDQGTPRRNSPCKRLVSLRAVCDSESPCVYPHVLFLSPNKHFARFTTFCPCKNYFQQIWKTRALSLSTDLVSSIRCSHSMIWIQSLVGNWNPVSSCCRLRLPKIMCI